jgi:FPC/CPF motif-containing protein YcgG
MVFNPHAQFEELRKTNRYEKMKNIVRQRDILYSGSVNPMLADFGEASEVYQYSGRQYDGQWSCPLKVTHAESKNNSTPQ